MSATHRIGLLLLIGFAVGGGTFAQAKENLALEWQMPEDFHPQMAKFRAPVIYVKNTGTEPLRFATSGFKVNFAVPGGIGSLEPVLVLELASVIDKDTPVILPEADYKLVTLEPGEKAAIQFPQDDKSLYELLTLHYFQQKKSLTVRVQIAAKVATRMHAWHGTIERSQPMPKLKK